MDELVTFRELGYSRYKIINQALVNLHTCPNPAREGNNFDHVFPEGSSGLFGDELPGNWISLFEAAEAYRQIFRGYALNGDNGIFSGSGSVFSLLNRVQRKIARFRRKPDFINLPPVGWYDTHVAR